MHLGIAEKRAFLMASSAGLGLACAAALAREGARIILNGRHEDRLRAAAGLITKNTGMSCEWVAADVSTESGRAAIFERVAQVDILVTNNGGPPPGELKQWDEKAWLHAFGMNMIPQALMIRHYVPGMQERKFGRIVNITSAMVKSPRPHMGLSASARTALTAFSKAISLEIVRDNVTINQLLPERIDSPRQIQMTERLMKERDIGWDEARARITATIAAGRFGTKEEFGDACAYLCSAQAGFISGQNLQLDGGSYPGLL